MTPALERAILVLCKRNDYKEQELTSLILACESINCYKGLTIPEMEQILRVGSALVTEGTAQLQSKTTKGK